MNAHLARRLIVEFTKMTGAGNDFIVLDNRFYNFNGKELSDLAKRFCPRRLAVGADGLLALEESRSPETDYRMAYYNADGSRATMCGNGARCLGRFARLAGIEKDVLQFESDAGIYRVEVPGEAEGTVVLHVPPYKNYKPNCDAGPELGTGLTKVDYIWTGTDHIVVDVADADSYPVDEVGKTLRWNENISPDGSNVNFVQTIDSDDGALTLRVRTYERGVEAETLACGTGAIASALVSLLKNDSCSDPVRVEMRGGTLSVSVVGDVTAPQEILLEGPVDIVYRGTLEV